MHERIYCVEFEKSSVRSSDAFVLFVKSFVFLLRDIHFVHWSLMWNFILLLHKIVTSKIRTKTDKKNLNINNLESQSTNWTSNIKKKERRETETTSVHWNKLTITENKEYHVKSSIICMQISMFTVHPTIFKQLQAFYGNSVWQKKKNLKKKPNIF